MCLSSVHFRASIEVWQNVFPEFEDSQLQTAARLAHLMLIVCSTSARIHFQYESVSPQVRESTVHTLQLDLGTRLEHSLPVFPQLHVVLISSLVKQTISQLGNSLVA